MEVVDGDLRDFSFLRSSYLEQAQSIILPSEDELFNLNAALHAVEVNPDIQVVLRLFNLNLGKKLEKTVRNFTVLSVSQLASSNFASAALIEKPLLSFETGKEILNIYQIDSGILAGKSIAEIDGTGTQDPVGKRWVVPSRRPENRGGGHPDCFLAIPGPQHAYVGSAPADAQGQAGKGTGNNGFLNSVRQVDSVLIRTVDGPSSL